jgi:hypothetical protein
MLPAAVIDNHQRNVLLSMFDAVIQLSLIS